MYKRQLTTFHRGEWIQLPNPLAQLTKKQLAQLSPNGVVNEDAEYRAIGYMRAIDLTPGGDLAITLNVWARDDVPAHAADDSSPRYILQPTIGSEGNVPEPVGAKDTIDALDLLARWAPALTAAAYLDDALSNQEERDRRHQAAQAKWNAMHPHRG